MTDETRTTRRTAPRSHRLIPELKTVPVEPKYSDPAECGRRARAALGGIRFSIVVDPAEIIGRD
jgi:hypothetical protein